MRCSHISCRAMLIACELWTPTEGIDTLFGSARRRPCRDYAETFNWSSDYECSLRVSLVTSAVLDPSTRRVLAIGHTIKTQWFYFVETNCVIIIGAIRVTVDSSLAV
jgi:hypothetical protein